MVSMAMPPTNITATGGSISVSVAVAVAACLCLFCCHCQRKCPLLQTNIQAAGRIRENSKSSYYVVILEN